MKNLTLKRVENIVVDTIQQEHNRLTGNIFLDNRYEDQRQFAGGQTLPYYRILHQFAKQFKPKLSVELGSFQGTAAGHLAHGNPTGTVVTIDIHKDPGQELDKKKCDEVEMEFDNVHCLIGWTWDDHIVKTVKSFAPIDLLFVDAWHRKDLVEREWEIYEPLLSDKALVVCDDITNNNGVFEGMEEWWNEVKYPKFLNNYAHRGVPMGFFIYTRKRKK